MFEISKNARRLLESEKKQYKDEGYITGLPVFSEKAKEDLHSFFLSSNILRFASTTNGKIDDKKIFFLLETGSMLERSLGKVSNLKLAKSSKLLISK